ncbi:uncharacterized protein LOC105198811 [Solenopsis invicta]|uniref:uncharacterized protein LOC105198811 n=1 Tax=Solenopsis invicta TaxID=13686 RepID=UPI0001FEDF6D|nr:uncharacterized protein LOC105198811 [Solenopsis invicta]
MFYDKEDQRWLNEVMSKIAENLGPNVDKTRYDLSKSIILFMTNIYYVRLQFKNKTNSQNEELSIVLKRPLLDVCELRIESQFHNEMLFYEMYVEPDENHPRCLYINDQLPTDSVIALENVNGRGYYACPKQYDPPLEYTLAAMRELGRFHGKAYIMKEQRRKKFFNIVERLQNVRYIKAKNCYKIAVNTCGTRGVEYLRKHGHDAIFCDKMEALLSNGYDEVMLKLESLEPLSTLCHGDFTLSNVLFKTEEDGQYHAMLIDFALITYSTPVVDLSTYLCLCCSNEERRVKFSDIMRAYHDALLEYLLNAGVQDVGKYSYNALLDDFKRGALFGFIIASMFLPHLLENTNVTELRKEYERLMQIPKSVFKYKYCGGDKVCKMLADALLHLRDLGCLEHFL